MPDAPLLHRVPSLIGWPGSPSMWITLPPLVETTWPQPTPQKGHTVVVAVAPRVLIGGTAGPQPDCDNAPIATVPVVNPLRNWRRVGRGTAFLSEPSFSRGGRSPSLLFFILTLSGLADLCGDPAFWQQLQTAAVSLAQRN